jgi:hypothetical protein
MRKLSEKDIRILKKMAPEIEDQSRIEYHAILPPLSIHFAEDVEDFQVRLERLDSQELSYVVGSILDGSECLLCISPEFVGVFIYLLEEKLPGEDAGKIRVLYKSSTGYEA